MQEGDSVPAIRFSGFMGDWEQRKLGEISDSYSGGTPTVGVKEYYGGQIPFIRSAEINSYSTELFITEDGLKNSSARLVSKGDVLYALYGATSGEVGRARLNGAINQAILAIKPSVGYDCEYITQWLRKSKQSIVKTYLQGGQGNLSGTIVKDLLMPFPTLREQETIGTYFAALDHLITLHQHKYSRLCNIKKSMLEKMFPREGATVPEIRFAGFTDDWEQRKLGDIATFINGRAYSQSELLKEGKYKVLRVGNFYTNDSWYYSDLELSDKYYADYGNLLYTWSATFGPHIWFGNKVIYHYHIWKVELSNQLEKHFTVQLLEQDKANILSRKNGSTMVHITKEGMEQKEVIIPPNIAEQRAIGAYFEKLDHLITLHQRKLERLQNIKKAYLEKMFV